MIQFILYYLLCGVIFNLMFDLLVSSLGPDAEKNRLTMLERLFTTLTWPIPFLKLVFGIANTIINKKDE